MLVKGMEAGYNVASPLLLYMESNCFIVTMLSMKALFRMVTLFSQSEDILRKFDQY